MSDEEPIEDIVFALPEDPNRTYHTGVVRSERDEIRDTIAISVFNGVPDNTTVVQMRELIERLTDISMHTLEEMRKRGEL